MLSHSPGIVRTHTFRGVSFKYYDIANCAHYIIDEVVVRDRWWHVNSGDVILDIGAGFGSYALPACALGATVYAFSPEADMGDVFVMNVDVNGFNHRCQIYTFGLYDRQGYNAPMSQRFSTEPIHDEVSFLVLPLDQFMENHREISRVDWVKVDVEGAELEVLRGGVNTIRKFTPRILVENHLFKRPNVGLEVKQLI